MYMPVQNPQGLHKRAERNTKKEVKRTWTIKDSETLINMMPREKNNKINTFWRRLFYVRMSFS